MNSDTPSSRQQRWVLYRIDDNGNEVEMQRFSDRASAERLMHAYQARGHKQTYLVREAC
ncbi:hypothetical protein [Pseudomonas sp.]|uniref:hypothetical protein n=1 Tax=Pseudomonas sp. TaxID=306 RepID=UPI003D0E41B0